MRSLSCAGRVLTLEHPQVMGVLNITPDSFSDGGRLLDPSGPRLNAIVQAARAMLDAGAAILDIGGESTRPGAAPVAIDAELDRVIPVVEALSQLDTIVSVDTRHGEVAQAALRTGAHMINDVSAGADPLTLSAVAASGAGYVLMHMQGDPVTMQNDPQYDDVVGDVARFLSDRLQVCAAAGIEPDQIAVDPGFGFGKTLAHNLRLLACLEQVRAGERPLLVGLSRKGMLGALTGRNTCDRQSASVAAALIAVSHGADIVRVHDVADTVDALKIYQAVRAAGEPAQ